MSAAADDARQLAQLESEERALSAKRRRLHDRIDFSRGGAGIGTRDAEDQLRRLEDEERELSARRRELHAQIDALRLKLGQEPGPGRGERPTLRGG